MRMLKDGINSIVFVGLLLSLVSAGAIRIHFEPVWLVLRQTILATLGAPTPGFQVEGESNTLICNQNTGQCEWE